MTFLTISLLFGEISKHQSPQHAGWLVMALTALAGGLLVHVPGRRGTSIQRRNLSHPSRLRQGEHSKLSWAISAVSGLR
jgi:hypothetical protein